MARFLIEVPHEGEIIACAKVVDAFLKTGSHFLSSADWGCQDGEHKAWLIVEVESRNDARLLLPPPFRKDAKIVELNKFTLDEIGAIFRAHGLE
jgi:hypothetical protein